MRRMSENGRAIPGECNVPAAGSAQSPHLASPSRGPPRARPRRAILRYVIERDEVFRLRTRRKPGTLATVLSVIAQHGAHCGEIETIAIVQEYNIRDITVVAPGDEAVDAIRRDIATLPEVEIVEQTVDRVFAVHEGGKIEVRPTVEVRNLQDQREVYTPGVARVSAAIRDEPSLADRYTWRGRTVAIVSDGSRVLGLGDIGPAASLPVMEGKALFYSLLVDLNAVPIVLDTSDPAEIVETVIRIAPGFGGIHLEDIASPGVYRIEEELIEHLDVPVMHDDQHGTAVVVLAAVLSAARILERPLDELAFGQVGLGAAGSAIAALAMSFPFKRVLAFDTGREAVERLVAISGEHDTMLEAAHDEAGFDRVVEAADVLVLTTGRPGLLPPEKVRSGSVIAALSNPIPEITIDDALEAGAAIATDGSIVNNVLAYPGLFRGALDADATSITVAMKHAAATVLSSLAGGDSLLPDPLDREVHAAVAEAVAATS